MKKLTRFAILICSIFCVLQSSLAEKTNEPADNKDEIVVSASRDRRTSSEIPANVTVLESADIDRAGTVSVVEPLRNLDGILFRSYSGEESQAEISMRGFGENSQGRVLILLDGRRLNRPDMQNINWSQIPINTIERIEILRGPQTALYGDNAVAGVINIITKKGTPVPEISISALAGSYGLNSARIGLSAGFSDLLLTANGERTQADGYRDRSSYLTWGGRVGAGYDINPDNNLSLSIAYDQLYAQLPGPLSKAEMDDNPRQSLNPDDDSKRKYAMVDAAWKSIWSDSARFDIGAFYANSSMDSHMTSWLSFADVGINSVGLTPRFTLDNELLYHRNTFLVGFDGYLDYLKSDRYNDPQKAGPDTSADVNRSDIALYARNEHYFTEYLMLGLGARQEQCRIAADVNSDDVNEVHDNKTHNANAFDVSLNYLIGKMSKVFARASTVFRFPFVDEQVSYVGYGADKMYNNLEKEQGQNYEIGTEIKGPSTLSLNATLFLLNMQNEIAYNGVTFSNENMDNTRRQGAELSASYLFAEVLTLFGNYTLVNASFTSGDNKDNKVPLVPENKVSAGLKYALPFNFSIEGVFTYIDNQYLGSDNANAGDKLAGYALTDLALRFKPKILSSFEVFIGVDNVFNNHYAGVGYWAWQSAYYYPSADRTYKAGLAFSF
ncbi:TonB-dependent receptor [Verrucomicrobiota bacterium]